MLVPISPPTHSCGTMSGTFPLCTASLWDLSLDIKTLGLYCMYLWWQLLTCSLANVERGVGCCKATTVRLCSLSAYWATLSYFWHAWKQLVHRKKKKNALIRVEIMCLSIFHPAGHLKPEQLVLLLHNLSMNDYFPSRYKRNWFKNMLTSADSLPNNCSEAICKKKQRHGASRVLQPRHGLSLSDRLSVFVDTSGAELDSPSLLWYLRKVGWDDPLVPSSSLSLPGEGVLKSRRPIYTSSSSSTIRVPTTGGPF